MSNSWQISQHGSCEPEQKPRARQHAVRGRGGDWESGLTERDRRRSRKGESNGYGYCMFRKTRVVVTTRCAGDAARYFKEFTEIQLNMCTLLAAKVEKNNCVRLIN